MGYADELAELHRLSGRALAAFFGEAPGTESLLSPSGGLAVTHALARLCANGVNRFYLFATQAGFPLYRSLGFATLAEDAAWVKGSSIQTH